jgi:2'-5' RNA ligase
MPDPATAALIRRRTSATIHRYQLDGRPIDEDRLHITLYQLGNFEPQSSDPTRIQDWLQRRLVWQFASFEVTLDRALSFRGRENHPFVLTGSKLEDLHAFHRQVGDVLGLPTRGFTPHLTLVRSKKSIPVHDIQPVAWKATEFVLVKSFLGQSRYEILERWPLGT